MWTVGGRNKFLILRYHLRGHSASLSAWIVAHRTCWCRSCKLARQTAVLPAGRHHVGERLGQHDDALLAHGLTGREPRRRRTIVDPPLRHGEHPRQGSHPCNHAGDIPSCRVVFHPAPHSTSYVQPCDVAVFRSLQKCIASEHHACPARHRRLVRGHRDEQKSWWRLKASSCCHRPLRQRSGVDHWMDSLTRTQQLRVRSCRRRGQRTARRRRAVREMHRARVRSRRAIGNGQKTAAIVRTAHPLSTLTNLERCIALHLIHSTGLRSIGSRPKKNTSTQQSHLCQTHLVAPGISSEQRQTQEPRQ